MKNSKLSKRDKTAIETLARTGISFDDLCDAFIQYPYNEIEKVYIEVWQETVGDIQAGMRVSCS